MKGLSNKRSQFKGKITEEVALSIKYKENLEKMSKRPRLTQEERNQKDILIAKGIEFSENNIPFDMVPEEFKQHHFFKVGYDIGERRKMVENLQKGRLR